MPITYTLMDSAIEAQITSVSDWDLFDQICTFIQHEFGGVVSKQLDSLDQRYWDFTIEKVPLTLHLEHYLGISLFSTRFSFACSAGELASANALVQEIGNALEAQGLIS